MPHFFSTLGLRKSAVTDTRRPIPDSRGPKLQTSQLRRSRTSGIGYRPAGIGYRFVGIGYLM